MPRSSFRVVGYSLLLFILLLLPFWSFAQERSPVGIESTAPLSIDIISPLPQERAEGTIVLMARPSSSIESITVHAGGETLILSPENNWTSSLDTTSFSDGEQSLAFEGCIRDSCARTETTIRVANRPAPEISTITPTVRKHRVIDTPSTSIPVRPITPLVEITPPSFANFTIVTAPNSSIPLARSSGSPIILPAGTYDASTTFLDGFLTSLSLFNTKIDSNNTLVQFRKNIPVAPIEYRSSTFAVISSLEVSIPYSTRSQEIIFPYEENTRLFYCSSFIRSTGSCAVTWIPASREQNSLILSWRGSSGVFARVSRTEDPLLNPLISITLADVPGDYFVSSPFREIGPLDNNAYLFPAGEYALHLLPFTGPLESIDFAEVSFSNPGTFLTVTPILQVEGPPSQQNPVWIYSTSFPFSTGTFTLPASVSSSRIRSCNSWDFSSQSCLTNWELLRDNTFTNPLVLQQLSSIPDQNVSPYPFEITENLTNTILWTKRLNTNKRFFEGVSLRETYPALQKLTTGFEISLECENPFGSLPSLSADTVTLRTRAESFPLSSVPSVYFDENSSLFYSNAWESLLPDLSSWRQHENSLACDGVMLDHTITPIGTPPDTPSSITLGGTPHDIKEEFLIRNTTNQSTTRLVSIRLEGVFDTLFTGVSSHHFSEWYQYVPTSPESSIFTLQSNGSSLGVFDVSDFIKSGFNPRVLIHRHDNLAIIETLLEIPLSPGEELLLDPIYTLNNSQNYWLRYGGTVASDAIGNTAGLSVITNLKLSLGPGVQLVNVDNGSYANDLLITAPSANVANHTDNGAIYLYKNIDLNAGSFDVNSPGIISAYWYGSVGNDKIGFSNSAGNGAQLVDIDGNGYTNDLIVISSASFTAAGSGSFYIIKDIDTKSGAFDLNSTSSFAARWDGEKASESFPNTFTTGPGIQVINADNDSIPDDLLVASAGASTIFNGAVYLIMDAYTYTGIQPTSSSASYSARWTGATFVDLLSGSPYSGNTVFTIDSDGNGYANDLLIGASLADVSASDSGGVYFIKDIDTKSGDLSLSSSTNYSARWAGAAASNKLTDTLGSDSGIQVFDLDGNGLKNDLILTAVHATINGSSLAGVVYMIKDINTLSGDYPLSSSSSYNARWYGGSALDVLGASEGSGSGVKIFNLDGNSVANDLLLHSFSIKTALTTKGGIYLVRDINTLSGDYNMASSSSYNLFIHGSQTNDNIGSTYFSGTGVQVVNIDNNLFANDLLISDVNADTFAVDTGAVYVIRDINKYVGTGNILDLNTSSNFDLRFSTNTLADHIGWNDNSGEGVFVTDIDHNGYTNDLIISAPYANVNSLTDNGAIYLIKDIDKKSGIKDLSLSTDYSLAFYGSRSSDFIGRTLASGEGIQLTNTDRNNVANDLTIVAPLADSTAADAGSIYLIRDIGTLAPQAYDLNNYASFYRRYNGATASDKLGSASNSIDSVFWKDIDNDGYPNDIFIGGDSADINSRSNTGVVYVITNQSFGGLEDYSFSLSLPSSTCTNGLGNITGGTACEKGYVSTTSATSYKVSPDGQSPTIPFFVFDNQSSTQSDFNVVLDLNASLPSYITLKAGTHTDKWFLTCGGDTSTSCVSLSDANASLGKISYSSGTQDLNIWFWADFTGATDGTIDRNVNAGATSTG